MKTIIYTSGHVYERRMTAGPFQRLDARKALELFTSQTPLYFPMDCRGTIDAVGKRLQILNARIPGVAFRKNWLTRNLGLDGKRLWDEMFLHDDIVVVKAMSPKSVTLETVVGEHLLRGTAEHIFEDAGGGRIRYRVVGRGPLVEPRLRKKLNMVLVTRVEVWEKGFRNRSVPAFRRWDAGR